MSDAFDNNETDPDRAAGKQADAMKDRLRKDVASWSAARAASHSHDAADLSVPVPPTKPSAPQPTAQVKRRKPVAPSAEKPVDAPRKPFRMSYDGVSDADYISYIIERGA